MKGLPPEAAIWREDRWTPEVEFAAATLERLDQWFRVLAAPVTGAKQIAVPAPLQIVRPGEEPPEEKKPVTDPREVAAWFARKFK